METILLVDDESAHLRALKAGLLCRGYHIFEASDGLGALDRLADLSNRIELVITDYSMPGMNGMELLEIIKEKYRSMPVMIMTAYGEKSHLIEALKNQCDGFIEKPFALDALILEIQRIKYHKLRNIDSHELTNLIPRIIHQINNPLSVISGNAQLGTLNIYNEEALKKRFKSISNAVDSIIALMATQSVPPMAGSKCPTPQM